MVRWHHRLNAHESEHSWSRWWTGRPGMLQSMGLQRVRCDWMTELNWQVTRVLFFFFFNLYSTYYSDYMNSINLSWNSVILTFCHPHSANYCFIVTFVYVIFIWFFFITSVSLIRFFSVIWREFVIYLVCIYDNCFNAFIR